MSIDSNFSIEMKSIISRSRETAIQYKNGFIAEVHIVHAILSDDRDHLGFSGIDNAIREAIVSEAEGYIKQFETTQGIKESAVLPITTLCERAFHAASKETEELGHAYVYPIHLLLAFMKQEGSFCAYFFPTNDITYDKLQAYGKSMPFDKKKQEGWFWQRRLK